MERALFVLQGASLRDIFVEQISKWQLWDISFCQQLFQSSFVGSLPY